MNKYTNETADQRFVIVRKHRGGAEGDTNIILLPGDSAEVDVAVYDVQTYTADLSEEDMATLAARPPAPPVGDGAATNPPTVPPELSDEDKKALADHVEMERAAAQMQAEGGSATGSGSDGAGQAASTDPSISTPTVDNDHVAEGAEQFAAPPANPPPVAENI